MIARVVLASVVVALVGCTSDTERSALADARDYFTPNEYVPPPRFTALFNEPRPILDIEFIDLGVAGKLILEQQDGDFARYLSADLGGIVLQNGMLHSIYGFGEPLVGAELSQPLALVLAGRPGQADRFHTYVDGEDQTVRRTYRCEVAVQGVQDIAIKAESKLTLLVSETCQSLTNSFENFYWVDLEDREIIQSRQWVGSSVGAILTRVTPQ